MVFDFALGFWFEFVEDEAVGFKDVFGRAGVFPPALDDLVAHVVAGFE